jgi:hypothetical protein
MGDAAMNETTTKIYKDQHYELVGHEPYTRVSDGSKTSLIVWRSVCATCGQPFVTRTPIRAKSFTPGRRCDLHKQPGVRVKVVPV